MVFPRLRLGYSEERPEWKEIYYYHLHDYEGNASETENRNALQSALKCFQNVSVLFQTLRTIGT